MKIAISIWNQRVSPVMDTARQLALVEIDGGIETTREIIGIPETELSRRAEFIRNLGVDALICGAISFLFEDALRKRGINVYAWIRGELDSVIKAFAKGDLLRGEFSLPGCRRRRCRYGSGNKRGRRMNFSINRFEEDL